jgi:hypothetical protein
MDSLVLDSPYLEELFLFESEENALAATSSEDESDEEAHNLDGFSSSEESDDDENIPSIPVCIENTRLKKAKLEGNLAAKVRNILDYISTLGLDLPLFLDAVSWGSPQCHSDRKIQYARTSLLASKELPQILRRWLKPPRRMKEGKGRRPRGARETLYQFALECVTDKIDREMKASAFLFTSPSEEFSEAHLLDMDFEKKMKPNVQSYAPTLWQLIKRACTPKQESSSKEKNRELVRTN